MAQNSIKNTNKLLHDAVVKEDFLKNSELFLNHYSNNKALSVKQFSNISLARDKAAQLRRRTINNLANYLTDFESAFKKRKQKVTWAVDDNEVQQELSKLLRTDSDSVLLHGSWLIHELKLKEYLTSKRIKHKASGFGSDLQKQFDQKSNHCRFKGLNFDYSVSKAEDYTIKERRNLSADKSLKSSIGATIAIIEAKYLFADTGYIAFFDEEGMTSIMMSAAQKIIILASIDSVLPSMSDMYLLNPLTACYETGKIGEERIVLFSGKANETTSVELILVDNKRSELLASKEGRMILETLDSTGYINGDNFYKSFGKYTTEPTNYLHAGLKQTELEGNIDEATISLSTLSGFEDVNGPSKVNFRRIVLLLREQLAKKNKKETDLIWRSWKSAMLSRKFLNRSSIGPFSLMKSFFKRGTWNNRVFPQVPKSSFNEQWVKERPNEIKSKKLSEIPKGQLLVRKPATDGLSDTND